jgi:hypothetical protein
MFAYLAVVAQQRVYMLQYYKFSYLNINYNDKIYFGSMERSPTEANALSNIQEIPLSFWNPEIIEFTIFAAAHHRTIY